MAEEFNQSSLALFGSDKRPIWDGAVFHSSLEDGKSECKISISGPRLFGITNKKSIFTVNLTETSIYWGGSSKSLLLFAPHFPKVEPTFSVRNRAILKEIKKYATSPALIEEIKGLQRDHRAKYLWLLGTLFVLLLTLFGSLFAFLNYGVDWVTRVIPYSVDQKIGELTFEASIQQLSKNGERNKSVLIKKAMQKIINRLTKSLKSPFLFEIAVVNSKIPNAFALPGGKIAILTGLIEKAEKPEEVAGVLAHEINHVIGRHGIKNLVQKVGVTLMLEALFGNSSVVIQNITNKSNSLIGLKFSRNMESEADRKGFLLLERAKIDPSGMEDFFRRIQKLESSYSLSWNSSHPVTKERIQNIKNWKKNMVNFTPKPIEIEWEKIKEELKKNK